MTDPQITAQVSDSETGEVTNHVLVDADGQIVATDAMSDNVTEFFGLLGGIAAMINDDDEEGLHGQDQ